jgi:hypothetical protein
MADWDYGGAWRRYDLSGVIDLPDGSRVQVCDWRQGLPAFMREADTLFIDPPWSLANLRSFYTKADQPHPATTYETFAETLMAHIDTIAPQTLFLEVGLSAFPWYLAACEARYPAVTSYQSTYYRRPPNRCRVIHATRGAHPLAYPHLNGLDEADIIAWICREHPYACIGDLCMGTGLVGKHAYRAGRRFVGTELNPKRLAVLVEFIATHPPDRRTSRRAPLHT